MTVNSIADMISKEQSSNIHQLAEGESISLDVGSRRYLVSMSRDSRLDFNRVDGCFRQFINRLNPDYRCELSRGLSDYFNSSLQSSNISVRPSAPSNPSASIFEPSAQQSTAGSPPPYSSLCKIPENDQTDRNKPVRTAARQVSNYGATNRETAADFDFMLRDCYSDLVNLLINDSDLFISALYKNRLLSRDQAEKMRAVNATSSNKATDLMIWLPRKGSSAAVKAMFVDALRDMAINGQDSNLATIEKLMAKFS